MVVSTARSIELMQTGGEVHAEEAEPFVWLVRRREERVEREIEI